MALLLLYYGVPYLKIPSKTLVRSSSSLIRSPNINYSRAPPPRLSGERASTPKRCLRCGALYWDKDNSPMACFFHGHTTGERGLFSLAPPHQGIDGEWSDKSGIIVYRWNEKGSRPNTGSANWKKRWSCCAESMRTLHRAVRIHTLLVQLATSNVGSYDYELIPVLPRFAFTLSMFAIKFTSILWYTFVAFNVNCALWP